MGGNALKDADQVDDLAILGFAGLHRASAGKDRRNVCAHGAHNHAGHNLVAVGNTDHGIERMGADHGFHGVGDELPAGQRIFHTGMAHGDAVAYTDHIKFNRCSARFADRLLHQFAHLVEVRVARDDFVERVTDGNERLLDILRRHSGGPHETAVRCPLDTLLSFVAAHSGVLSFK